MSLKQEITHWDKKSRKYIVAVFATHAKRPNFLKDLIGLACSYDTQCGATWLIKHYLENRASTLSPAMVSKLFNAAHKSFVRCALYFIKSSSLNRLVTPAL